MVEDGARTTARELLKAIEARYRFLDPARGAADLDGRPVPGRVAIYLPYSGRDPLASLPARPHRRRDSSAG